MAETYHLSISIGPVQAFVVQARRTRDLWAGSWLLSYLAESALAAAEQAGGVAIIPHRTDEQRGVVTAKQTPVGGMPNRFELMFTGDDGKERAVAAAKAAKEGFRRAWEKVATAVFDEYVSSITNEGKGTEEIWLRQIGNFWELSWVVGTPDDGSGTIGRLGAIRKNFRNVNTAAEPGIKCSLMPTLQEISGHFGNGQRDKQTAFWQALRQKLGGLELGDSERLSAIALIKRLFPTKRVIKNAIGDDISPDLDQVGWPSTAFMAALPWLKQLDGDAQQPANEYQEAALPAGYETSERNAARDAGIDWASTDGPIWFASAIRNDEPGREKLGPKPSDDAKRERDGMIRNLLDQLKQVYRSAAGDSTGNEESRPAPYYALLLMDGDELGTIPLTPQERSQSLDRFARMVELTVAKSLGRTVYAGGDDVMALLPAETATEAAAELREKYHEAFGNNSVATISAAVVYAHWRYPLRQVLRTAHRLLDDVAKEATGRDAVALGVVLGSGLNAVWSVPWDVFLGRAKSTNNDSCVSLLDVLDKFEVSERDDTSNPPFNASYLYLLRDRFGRLFDKWRDEPGRYARFDVVNSDTDADAEDLLRDLAHAEYRRRMSGKKQVEMPSEQTLPRIEELMSLSRRWKRERLNGRTSGPVITCDRNTFSLDGWRVARFLKQVKDGKVGDHD